MPSESRKHSNAELSKTASAAMERVPLAQVRGKAYCTGNYTALRNVHKDAFMIERLLEGAHR